MIKIKKDLDEAMLEEIGYRYIPIEGGYLSGNGATMISISRAPYQREVMPYKAHAAHEHEKNIKVLRNMGALEESEE